MVEQLCCERDRKSEVVDAAVSSHKPQTCIFLLGREEGSVVRMGGTRVRAAATSHTLLSKNREHVVVFEDKLCDVGVAAVSGGIDRVTPALTSRQLS